MKYPALALALVSTLGLAASSEESADCGHHGPSAYMPSQCPYVSTTTGFHCTGFVSMDGLSIAGDKYKCSNGHHWVVAKR